MASTIQELEEVLRERRAQRPAGSYSAELFDDPELVQRKVMEEAFEVCLELGRAECDKERVAGRGGRPGLPSTCGPCRM